MKTIDRLHEDPVLATEINKLETRVWRIAQRDALKVIMITSAVRGEGKSTTTAYLATVMGMYPGRRVLVVDLDLRIPALNSHFGLAVRRGVEFLLAGSADLRDVVIHTELPSLQVMLPSPSGADPTLLLQSQRLDSMLGALRESYDLILVDVPAIIPVPDATILMPHVDAVMLASMAGKTSSPQLARAVDICKGLDANIIGLIISNVREAAPDYLADHYNYYGYVGAAATGEAPHGR